MYEVLPRLADLRKRRAGSLSGGEQQMVAFGRALMAEPDAIVVDELSLGLAPLVTADLAEHLRALNAERGLAVLLIEQNARLALGLCGRGYVLEAGRIRAEGTAADLAAGPDLTDAYLGGPAGWEGRGMSDFVQYLISGIAVGCGFALLASGLVAIHRVTRVVNFAQGMFAVADGMTAAPSWRPGCRTAPPRPPPSPWRARSGLRSASPPPGSAARPRSRR